MKKIYSHEMNEAKAVKATLQCFNKRKLLTEGNIAEIYPETRWKEGQERLAGPNGMSKTERALLIKLEEQIPTLVEKAMLKVQDHEDPQSIKKLILDMIVKKFVSKMAEKLGTTWIEFSMGFKKELKNMVIDSIEQHNSSKEEQEEIGVTGQPQEMEEYPQRMEIQDLTHALTEDLSESWIATDTEDDYERLFYAVSDTLAKYKDYPQSTDWEDCKEWCQKHYQEIEEKAFPQEEQEFEGVNRGGMHNLVQVDRIMNTSSKYESDEEERYNQAFRVIAELIADQLDREFPNDGIPTEMDILFDVIKEYESSDREHYLLDTDEDQCEIWAEENYEDVKEIYLDRANNYIMDTAHDDLFAQEQEEMGMGGSAGATLQGEAWSGYISSHYQEDEDYDPFEWEYDEYSKYSTKPDKSLRVKYKGRTLYVSITPAVEKEMKENSEDDISDIQKDPRGASILAHYIQRMIDDAGYEPSHSERNFLKKYQSIKG